MTPTHDGMKNIAIFERIQLPLSSRSSVLITFEKSRNRRIKSDIIDEGIPNGMKLDKISPESDIRNIFNNSISNFIVNRIIFEVQII